MIEGKLAQVFVEDSIMGATSGKRPRPKNSDDELRENVLQVSFTSVFGHQFGFVILSLPLALYSGTAVGSKRSNLR